MDKIFRIGHRTPSNGVITIATKIVDNNIYYGVSYCSPREKTYSKSYGVSIASQRLEQNLNNNISLELKELKHSRVVIDVLVDILVQQSFPAWAESLLIENALYPVGLLRYSNKKENKPVNIKSIVVDSEHSKEQLLIALDYIHGLFELDTNFIAVNELAHVHLNPDLIVVE